MTDLLTRHTAAKSVIRARRDEIFGKYKRREPRSRFVQ
jgi:hypothetical protein